jgi:crotonobetaine/carnitine-CoA ligase
MTAIRDQQIGAPPPVSLLRDLVGADDASIPEVWKARVERSAGHDFLISEGRRWTYADAWEEILRFGGHLERTGLGGSGQRVATFLSNRAVTLWAWFGAVTTGAAHFALNREHRGPVLQDMVRRCGASVLVTEANALPALQALGPLPFREVIFADAVPPGAESLASEVMGWSDATAGTRLQSIAQPRPTDVAGILFTSGTTGRSKAALLSHNAYCRGAARVAAAWGWNEDDIFHAWLPLFHIAGQMHQTMSMVVAGGTLAQFPTFSRSQFWKQVADTKATIVCGLSNVLHLWARTAPNTEDAKTTLRSVIAAAIPRELHRALEERFGLTIMEQYGMTEAELLTLPAHPGERVPLGSCGRAGPDFELRVVDEEDRPVTPGKIGEIVARPKAPGLVMLGYEGDDAATVRAWRNLWFHTGDSGYLDADGCLFYVDRLKHMIRRRGENISSFELEATLATCPFIEECAAVGVPSPLGEQDVKVVAVLRMAATATPKDIYDFCNAHMARFMVPRYVQILGELPHNQVGKVEKEKLKSLEPGTWDAEAFVTKRKA